MIIEKIGLKRGSGSGNAGLLLFIAKSGELHPGNSRDRRCGVSEFLFCKNPVSCIWETVEIDGAEYRSFFVAKTW